MTDHNDMDKLPEIRERYPLLPAGAIPKRTRVSNYLCRSDLTDEIRKELQQKDHDVSTLLRIVDDLLDTRATEHRNAQHFKEKLAAAEARAKIADKDPRINGKLDQLRARVAELEKNPLNMCQHDIHAELKRLREQLAALTAPVDDAEIAEIEREVAAVDERLRDAESRGNSIVMSSWQSMDNERTLLRYSRQQKARGDALAGYARHKGGCDAPFTDVNFNEFPCTCGLSELLEDENE